MRDAVAEVLAERTGRGALSMRRGLALSLALHALVFVALLAGAHRSTPERVNVLNIRFAPSPAPPARPPARPAPTPPAALPKANLPEPPPTPPPARKEAYAPKQESVFGRSDRPVAAPKSAVPSPSPAPPTAAPPAASEATPPLPAVGTAGVSGLEGGDFPYTIYVDQMVAKIGSNWFRPQSSGEPLAQVHFIIDRDGRIREVEIRRSSGIPAFDRAARRAVIESSPLPPLPFGYGGTWLGVHLTFH
ncbi:MAG TPA: energy transducer TonB [Thermoanaerobaculia bacterium]|nr:energy transducer TonB [Thermoanaerobaculia bacterium]